MVITNNPSPRGPLWLVLTETRLAVENDILVLADEVYERLIYDGEKHISIASLPGMKNAPSRSTVSQKHIP